MEKCKHLFIYALTYRAVSSLDKNNRMISEYEFESFRKKVPWVWVKCFGIYQVAVLV
jgi:hypothetical protein